MSPGHVIRTARLKLEPTVEAHADMIYAALDDPAMWEFFPAYRPRTLQALRERYRRFAAGYPYSANEELWENWTAFLRHNGEPVGSMQATIAIPQCTAHIGYAIHRPHWRKGYAAEGALAVIEHLQNEHAVRTVFAQMNTENHASVGLIESLGFRRIERREQVDSGNGLSGDEYLYERHSTGGESKRNR